VGVHPRRSRGILEDLDLLVLEDSVEGLPVLAVVAVAVSQQEARGLHARAEIGGQVSGLLYSPVVGGVGGDGGDVQASGAVFEERQRVEPVAEGGVEVEEIDGDDAFGLVGEELPPRRACAAWGRVDARRVEDLPYCGGCDGVTESGRLALDPPMPPLRVLPSELRISFSSAALVGGRPVRARRAL
jgi:hypothetical protein